MGEAGRKSLAFSVQRLPHPIIILLGSADELKTSNLKRDRFERDDIFGYGIDVSQVHQGEIAPIGFMASNTFIVVQKIAAAVENKAAPMDVDALGVMRRVTIDDGYIGLRDQRMCEPRPLLRHGITPIGSPM